MTRELLHRLHECLVTERTPAVGRGAQCIRCPGTCRRNSLLYRHRHRQTGNLCPTETGRTTWTHKLSSDCTPHFRRSSLRSLRSGANPLYRTKSHFLHAGPKRSWNDWKALECVERVVHALGIRAEDLLEPLAIARLSQISRSRNEPRRQ